MVWNCTIASSLQRTRTLTTTTESMVTAIELVTTALVLVFRLLVFQMAVGEQPTTKKNHYIFMYSRH